MFTKILIANRGEIVCRIAATARRMGVRTVAVYSDADARALHVARCDEAVRIGPAAPRESYLRGDLIIQAALATGAQAVHPGYGFLSENEDFAQACVDAGLVFIGPPAAAIKAMGLKAEAKRLMALAGVPLVPGYHGADQSPEVLQGEADAMGYPVLIKASAGGGGKGMRVVPSAAEFAAALAACQREAQSSFGDANVLIERYLTQPRHIEMQVFADTQGNIVHLFERDCSVQRRHQKILEEAPAPGMTPERRAQMGEAAIKAARAVGYVGAGTVEFIAEPQLSGELRYYFMEMNTRLQVEHPVTEAITGVDLVEWQLRIAAGEPLPRQQHELHIHGHAIEARICAENTERQFLPSTGTLHVFRTPAAVNFERADCESSGVRLDAGVREGDAITPFYDPMIAKLIAWGTDRAQALARLDAALAQTHIVGPHTNTAFLRRVAASPSFTHAELDTALIERERAALFNAPPLALEWAVAAWVAHLLAAEQAQPSADPWARRDGWRLHGSACRTLPATWVAAVAQTAAAAVPGPWLLEQGRDGGLTLHIGPQTWALQTASCAEPGWYTVHLGAQQQRLAVYPVGTRISVFGDSGTAVLETQPEPRAANPSASALQTAGPIVAPMPGKLCSVLVATGQTVRAGQALLVLEAMKMEHTVAAPRDGTVQAVLCAVGDAVREGAELLRLGE